MPEDICLKQQTRLTIKRLRKSEMKERNLSESYLIINFIETRTEDPTKTFQWQTLA